MLIEVEAKDLKKGLLNLLTSPVYIDCRKLISYPRVRHTLMDFGHLKLLKHFESIDPIAGGETAGIPFARDS